MEEPEQVKTLDGDAVDPREQDGSKGRHPTALRRRQAKRPPPPMQFYGLAAIIAILVGLGLVMVLSASSVLALHTDGSAWTYFVKQAVWTVLGIGALLITAKVPYHFWRADPGRLVGAFGLMVVVLVPGIGVTVNGARRGSTSAIAVQPAEVLKFALLLYGADLLARRADRMHEPGHAVPDAGRGGAGRAAHAAPTSAALVMAAIVLGVAFIAGTR
jgi:cell division protein FtsW